MARSGSSGVNGSGTRRTPLRSRVIGKGTYGCVLRPALPCGPGASSPRYRTRRVSKLMRASDATDELAVAALFRAADPSGDIVAVAERACPAPAQPPPPECGPLGPGQGALELLQLPDAGTTLSPALARSLSRTALLALLSHLAAGLATLHASGLVHLDIKAENVACMPPARAGAAPLCRFIDVGLGAAVASFNPLRSALGQPYDLYPLGARLLYALARARPLQRGGSASRPSPRWGAPTGWLARQLRDFYAPGSTAARLVANWGVPPAAFFGPDGAPLYRSPDELHEAMVAGARAARAPLPAFLLTRTDVYMLALTVAQLSGGATSPALRALLVRALRFQLDAASFSAGLRALSEAAARAGA
jgi:hypothetical protein